jgi:hypothetical protein
MLAPTTADIGGQSFDADIISGASASIFGMAARGVWAELNSVAREVCP